MERVFIALCLLGLCSLGLGNELKHPVEDDDGSTDDEDFSGSGMEDRFMFTSDIINESGSVTTVGPVAVPVPTESEPRNVSLAAVDPTTKYKDTAKEHEEVLEKLDPTAEATSKTEALTPTTTAHLTASRTTADDLDVHWHLHQGRHHHKTTSPSMVEDPTQGLFDKSDHVHHIPLAEATTSPPSDDGLIVYHGITTTGPVKGGGIHDEVPVSTPFADVDKTAEPTDVNEGLVLVGLDEKQTTKVPLLDSDRSKDHVSTTHPRHDVELVEGGGDHIAVTTSPPLNEEDTVGVLKTTALTHDDDSKKDQVTTPADANKHHKHHHHHHHHHHNHTTAHTTDSDRLHNVPTLEPMDKFAPGPTDVEDDVKSEDKFTDRPEDNLAESSTHSPDDQQPFTSAFPALDEIDTDLPESKEDEESGDDTDTKDLFFETSVVGAKEGSERDAAVDNGSSDASHGIMERKELLAGIIAGGAVGLIFASFLVGFVLYRMKKKDEGSYSLEEPKQSNGGYQKPREQREFYA